MRTQSRAGYLFQPTLPARGATIYTHDDGTVVVISTHAPRTGSDQIKQGYAPGKKISTHAPRTGSDMKGKKK